MAKKDDKKIKGIDQPESAGSKLVTALIALIIIIIWLVVFAFLIKLDVGGIGSNVLYPVLKDVPLVNKILPSVSEEQQAEEGNYKYTTLKSANARIEELRDNLLPNPERPVQIRIISKIWRRRSNSCRSIKTM